MKSVLITGASTGIGEACALRLDRAGWRVFAGVRKPADADRLSAEGSPRLTTVTIDVTDGATIERAAADVARALDGGGLDGLVNNAGIAVAAPLELVPLDGLRRQLEVNVTGQIAVTQAFLPLVRRTRGRIVFMGSIGGRLATPFLGPYCASKFALEAIADALRLELAPWDIKVAIVEPGSIATPIWTKSGTDADARQAQLPPRPDADYSAAIAAMRKFAAETARRGESPSLVADAVLHALSAEKPKTRYLVGRDTRVRGLLARIIPDRMRDRLIARALKLPTSSS
jgi:NAD(P)-dependent dehydrogenase (short-subunit alcohol dehydrogenase family)